MPAGSLYEYVTPDEFVETVVSDDIAILLVVVQPDQLLLSVEVE